MQGNYLAKQIDERSNPVGQSVNPIGGRPLEVDYALKVNLLQIVPVNECLPCPIFDIHLLDVQ
jgi:hypothetical protein